MPNYRRAWVPGGTYFFTVAIAERSTSLLVDRIDDLRAAFRAAHAARPFVIDAIVILPDHLHCLWTLPERCRVGFKPTAFSMMRWQQSASIIVRRRVVVAMAGKMPALHDRRPARCP